MSALAVSPRTRFTAPEGATAVAPAEERGVARDAVRLLVARGGDSGGVRVTHRSFADLAAELDPGDLVVVNNSATIAGQIDGVWHRGQGSEFVVVHHAARLDDTTRVIELRRHPDAGRAVLDATVGEEITIGRARLTLVAPYPDGDSSPTGVGNRLWRVAATGDLDGMLARHGRPIAYGYLDRPYPLSAYQAVFSQRPGSAEMPSAGRPFTDALITRLVSRGVGVVPITLHTGVSSQEAGEAPAPEWYEVSGATAQQVNATRDAGRRVVAVGTTVTRALESAVTGDRVVASAGWTERVVTEVDPPRVVNGLVTGWHDPQASHLLLVESVAGPALTQAAYDAAVGDGYLWHEFGDAGLFLPES